MFDPIDPRQSLPDLELGILKYWREEDVFKRSMHRRKDGEVFNFYDGPPFATGLPHYGHILAGTIKDVIPRYQTMQGKHVKRRFGWDCHGLPIENLIEKEKGLKTKQDIEKMGIGTFNALCRGAVQRYTKEWRETVERLGRFVDMDWDYRTMDPDFMESVWWVFKELHKRGMIYESYKSMHVCPHCQTPLSNFEVTQGYKDIQDYSVTAMFELDEEIKGTKATKETKDGNTYVLAWTTTGWTLPGNLFLAVHPDVMYVTVASEKNHFIVAKDLVESVFKGKEFKIVSETQGKKLIGKTYKPLFPYFAEQYKENAFRIVEGEFVTTTDGTGIVHIATGYGEDDFEVGKREKSGVLQHVNIDGTFKKEVKDFAGKHAKPKDDHQSGDKAIAKWLKEHEKLFKAETFMHSYPHCWRCDSPLLNYATSSWFVAVEKIKPKMLGANAKTKWVPGHIRDGRFGKWLEGARDWAISRNRFWGTPLPIWKHADGSVEVIGSRDELVQKSGKRFTKLIVARHAESQGNVDSIYQGKVPGTKLTERGENQAKALAEAVKNQSLPITTIYYSPLERTRATAEAIAKATGAKLVMDARLREVEFGDYEGKHVDFDDLTFVRERRAHKMEQGKIENIYHLDGMETWSSIELRVGAFLDEVLPKHKGEAIVVVTHADLLMNFQHAFTAEDPHKIVHQPYPTLAGKKTFYFDHERCAQMDLHKETVDELSWAKPETRNTKHESVELILMRHGETDMNKQRLVQAETNMVLNKVGKEQAKAAAEKLKGTTFDAIVSSDFKRAHQTAKIIGKELGIEVRTHEAFRERTMGEWNGQPVDDVLAKIGSKRPAGATFVKETPPGGEAFNAFLARARKAHDWLLSEYAGKKVLVVTHGGFSRAFAMVTQNLPYEEAVALHPKNAHAMEFTLTPKMRRIDEVLDCWFESGSMPYAQEHFPFEGKTDVPPGFPADFIAEGLDQTRGWFYTLTVLASALYDCPAFKNCIVNGIVLAEDGKKMSKRLKNYPEPTEVIKKHGADAVRFALMSSPAVRGDDLRFSEKNVTEVVRTVLLPLWNAYRLFVTYANAANFKPSIDLSLKNGASKDQLDRWILLKTQELVNKMTTELDAYDLSATCTHLADSIDDLTNWYVRLSRRRLAGKGGEPSSAEATEGGQAEALDTLYRVLLANAQLLAPFCPFISEAIYLNLVTEEHGSVHFSDWPKSAEFSNDDIQLLALMENTRTVVSLGLSLRSDAKVRVRQPLASITFALPPSNTAGVLKELIQEELNVKQVQEISDASSLGSAIVMVDARKVGPRLGAKVQEVIRAGKAGEFEEKDGKIVILGEEFALEEAKLVYQSKEGKAVTAMKGIVATLDAHVTQELQLEGQARELIHAVQQLRKDAGLEFTDDIVLEVSGADEVMKAHEKLIAEETRSTLGKNAGTWQEIELEGLSVKVRLERRN